MAGTLAAMQRWPGGGLSREEGAPARVRGFRQPLGTIPGTAITPAGAREGAPALGAWGQMPHRIIACRSRTEPAAFLWRVTGTAGALGPCPSVPPLLGGDARVSSCPRRWARLAELPRSTRRRALCSPSRGAGLRLVLPLCWGSGCWRAVVKYWSGQEAAVTQRWVGSVVLAVLPSLGPVTPGVRPSARARLSRVAPGGEGSGGRWPETRCILPGAADLALQPVALWRVWTDNLNKWGNAE